MLKQINYEYRISKKAKSLRISVYRDLRVVITIPKGFNVSKLSKFVEKKSGWINKSLKYFKMHKGNPVQAKKGGYKKYKTQALELLKRKINCWNNFYNFEYKKIAVKNQKTRWGSCSRKGNLNFNYKVVFLPEHLLDYLVVHELCHLKEFNHSHKFWDLVKKTIPDYKKNRTELKTVIINFINKP